MTQDTGTQPDHLTGDESFDAYTAALSDGETPVFGHLVLYSIFDGPVTRDDLERWFRELGLDLDYVPPPLRAVDAFEKVTGPDGARASYSLEDPTAEQRPPRRRRGVPRGAPAGRTATLMVRHVRSDTRQIVRNLVREVRDEAATELSYDTHLGQCVFHRDTSAAEAGAGTLHVAPDRAAISALPEAEQQRVTALLFDIEQSYQRRCRYLSGDKLRSLVRRYVEGLGGIKVRPTGGVYFVHRRHAATLAALRELVARFEEGSYLARIPLPAQDEMREMIIAAFTTKATDDLNTLASDIAKAQRTGAGQDTVQDLHRRFRQLTDATAEHSQLLSTSLDDAEAALRLVKIQLGSLLANADG